MLRWLRHERHRSNPRSARHPLDIAVLRRPAGATGDRARSRWPPRSAGWLTACSCSAVHCRSASRRASFSSSAGQRMVAIEAEHEARVVAVAGGVLRDRAEILREGRQVGGLAGLLEIPVSHAPCRRRVERPPDKKAGCRRLVGTPRVNQRLRDVPGWNLKRPIVEGSTFVADGAAAKCCSLQQIDIASETASPCRSAHFASQYRDHGIQMRHERAGKTRSGVSDAGSERRVDVIPDDLSRRLQPGPRAAGADVRLRRDDEPHVVSSELVA